jgi:hypothetical protein
MEGLQKIIIQTITIWITVINFQFGHSQNIKTLDSIARSNISRYLTSNYKPKSSYLTYQFNSRFRITFSTRPNPIWIESINSGQFTTITNVGVYDIRLRWSITQKLRITQRCLILNPNQILFSTGMIVGV